MEAALEKSGAVFFLGFVRLTITDRLPPKTKGQSSGGLK
jgi:hypothetical protein